VSIDATDAEALRTELRLAYLAFVEQAGARRRWGLRTRSGRRLIGPYTAAQVAGIYRLMLGGFFLVGAALTVVGGLLGQLGAALVVGSLFAFGSWMAQAWSLSREAEFKAADELLFGLERERLEPYAERVRMLTRQLQELDEREH